jgi:hypothetical protein
VEVCDDHRCMSPSGGDETWFLDEFWVSSGDRKPRGASQGAKGGGLIGQIDPMRIEPFAPKIRRRAVAVQQTTSCAIRRSAASRQHQRVASSAQSLSDHGGSLSEQMTGRFDLIVIPGRPGVIFHEFQRVSQLAVAVGFVSAPRAADGFRLAPE